MKSEIDIQNLRSEEIILSSRQNLSYSDSERYFAETFQGHDVGNSRVFKLRRHQQPTVRDDAGEPSTAILMAEKSFSHGVRDHRALSHISVGLLMPL